MWHPILDLVQNKLCIEFNFELEYQNQTLEGFAVYHVGEASWFAYKNHCPHQGLPLNWLPNQFLDDDKAFIVCSMHLALFQPNSGECVHGPCVDQSLQKLNTRIQDGRLWVEFPIAD